MSSSRFVRAAAVILRAIAILAALAATAAPVVAETRTEAARALDGEWRSGDFVLRVDARRAQASFDPDKPFEWGRFLIKETADGEIVFTIGAELFEARLADGLLTLSSTAFRGTRVLVKESESVGAAPNLRGSTSD